jgi:hypothetical protein
MGRYVGRQELKEAVIAVPPQGIYDIGTWQITILQESRKDEGRTFLID